MHEEAGLQEKPGGGLPVITSLYLIRHGETEDGEVRRYKGSIDVPLSAYGIDQMKRVSQRIAASTTLKAIYSSDLVRAKKSAEIIGEPHGLRPEIIPGLRERSFGIWEGMSFDEIRVKHPLEFDAWAGNPLEFSPMDGETTTEVSARCMEALNALLNDHQGEPIAVVSHGGIIRIILCHMLGMPLENIFRIDQDYGALNVIEISDHYPVVRMING
jgi:alpha-ribazole phosphatase